MNILKRAGNKINLPFNTVKNRHNCRYALKRCIIVIGLCHFKNQLLQGGFKGQIPSIEMLKHHEVIEAAVPHLSRAVPAAF